jgi:hypothetical protein
MWKQRVKAIDIYLKFCHLPGTVEKNTKTYSMLAGFPKYEQQC